MIAAEQFRRRLMANRADIDCGYYTLTWQARDWGDVAYVQVINSDYIGNIISIEVNGITVPVNYVVPIQNADMTVKVRLRNLYSCKGLLQDIGYRYDSSGEHLAIIISHPYTIDVGGLDTSNSLSMELMFAQCYIIGGIKGLESLNLSKVTNMTAMFYQARGYDPADMIGWDTSKVTDMSSLFFSYLSIGEGLPTSFDLATWDTSKVTRMELMFCDQRKAVTININGWDTSKVTQMGCMFQSCEALTSLDLGSFDFSSIVGGGLDESEESVGNYGVSMYGMFMDCPNLTNLTIRGAISSEANTSYLFQGASTNGILKYNPAHLADYQAKIFPRLPSGWTTQAF